MPGGEEGLRSVCGLSAEEVSRDACRRALSGAAILAAICDVLDAGVTECEATPLQLSGRVLAVEGPFEVLILRDAADWIPYAGKGAQDAQ